MGISNLVRVQLQEQAVLSSLGDLFTEAGVDALMPEGIDKFSRNDCDGFITAFGWIGNRQVGIIMNDFRVNGGSFGREVSQRTAKFLDIAREAEIPVVFLLNTLGVRFLEGRTVFKETFSIIPHLDRFAEKNLLVTISIGRTLGLGALLFGMGHYRIAVREKSQINLTGPEVINLFFGKGFDFKAIAAAENVFEQNSLIHELSDDLSAALRRTKEIISTLSYIIPKDRTCNRHSPEANGEHMDSTLLSDSETKLRSVLAKFDGGSLEVFNSLSPIVRTFFAVHERQLIGVLINPPGHIGNVINTRALQKYSASLDLFKAARVPVISFVDTAGAEPRNLERERDLLTEFIAATRKLIQYPYPKMGFALGRCFGGATVLSFPPIFGGHPTYAVEGSRIGVMHDDIIAQLLSGSARMLEQWKATQETQTADLADLIKHGLIEGSVSPEKISEVLSRFVFQVRTKSLLEEVPYLKRTRNNVTVDRKEA
ncbi:MAG TPA: carboxyl transferase domain-containing protein [Bdellovibrionales bacterium]|nr:carboxyl transferase domain-containing protein [Bdellovibrionales bacterium]